MSSGPPLQSISEILSTLKNTPNDRNSSSKLINVIGDQSPIRTDVTDDVFSTTTSSSQVRFEYDNKPFISGSKLVSMVSSDNLKLYNMNQLDEGSKSLASSSRNLELYNMQNNLQCSKVV